MDILEILIKKIKEVSEQQINETISKGALKMSDDQIATISFAFWLVYMAETDLNDILKEAWSKTGSLFPAEVVKAAEAILKEIIGGKKEINIDNLEYFSDKIKVYEALFGKTNRTEILWKLKDIRNDLSHNRISDLRYDGELLSARSTKEKVLIAYFTSSLKPDFSKSEIWKSLSEDQKKQIEKMLVENSI